MGVPSYNTEQELIQLQTLGLSLNPDLVVLIFTINDLQPKMWVFDRRASTLLNIAQRSYAMSLLALAYWSLSGHEDRVPYLRNGDAHPRWPTVENAVAEIAHLCEANGVPLVLFTHESSPRVEAIAAQIGVPLVDLEPLLEDAREQRPGVALTVSKIDRHPNRAGTEMYSTLLRESLERLDLLPTGKTRADAAGRQDAAPGAAAQ